MRARSSAVAKKYTPAPRARDTTRANTTACFIGMRGGARSDVLEEAAGRVQMRDGCLQ
jgi:hypothetical protein